MILELLKPSPIHFLNGLSYTGLQGSWSISKGTCGANQAQGTITHPHTHSRITDNLEMPVSLKSMSLDCGRKLCYPEETRDA